MASTPVPEGTFVSEVARIAQARSFDISGRRQVVVTANGEIHVYENPAEAHPDPLAVTTLSAVASYVHAGIGVDGGADGIVVHVVSATEVRLTVPVIGIERDKLDFLVSKPSVPSIKLGSFMSLEEFIIQLQACFMDTPDRATILKLCGKLSAGVTTELSDDGVSQSIGVKAGITRSEDIETQSRYTLQPYRTFVEVVQPLSEFVFRMKQSAPNGVSTVTAALFEADGGAWRRRAIASIGAWLDAALPEETVVLA